MVVVNEHVITVPRRQESRQFQAVASCLKHRRLYRRPGQVLCLLHAAAAAAAVTAALGVTVAVHVVDWC